MDGENMPNQVQPGTTMIQSSPLLQWLGMESQLYSGGWSCLGILDSSGLDRRVRDAGWNLFFLADELRTIVPAWGGQNSVRTGLKRLLARTRLQHFNCMQVSQMMNKRFLGIPYMSIVAHSLHIQQGNMLQSSEERSLNGARISA
jgi:hypothetical protein